MRSRVAGRYDRRRYVLSAFGANQSSVPSSSDALRSVPGRGLHRLQRLARPSGDSATADGSSLTSDAPRGFVADNLKPLASDFKHLFTINNGLIVGIGGAAALAVHPNDRQVTSSFAGSHSVDETLDAGTVIGGGIDSVRRRAGDVRHRPNGRQERSGAPWCRSLPSAGGDGRLTQGIKFAADRTRPDGTAIRSPPAIPRLRLPRHPSSSSTTAGRWACRRMRSLATWAGSRLAENRHYLSDVLFGAAIGIIGGRAVTFGHGSHQFALTPIAVPGGAGVGLVHIGSH